MKALKKPRIYADFNGYTKSGSGEDWLILNGKKTLADLAVLGADFKDGLEAVFYDNDKDGEGKSDDIEVDGVLRCDPIRHWVAVVDWSRVRHVSDKK